MKVKKAIATILSTAMAVTAIPMTSNGIYSSAATNDIVVHVKSDWDGMFSTGIKEEDTVQILSGLGRL